MIEPVLIRQPRRWRRPLLAFALAQLVWLYSADSCCDCAVARDHRPDESPRLFVVRVGSRLCGRHIGLCRARASSFTVGALAHAISISDECGPAGCRAHGRNCAPWRDWRAGLMLVGGFLLHTFIAITYRAPQTVEYEMPAYVALAVMVGYGIGRISNTQSLISSAVAASVIVAGLANGLAHAPSFVTLAGDRSTREYVEPILRDAPSGAIILADWHFATPMWYLQQMEGLRRDDVAVRYVFPVGGQEISQVWRGLIEENIARRPVVVTHYWGLQYSTLPYTFEPFYQAWLVRDQPSFAAPGDLTPLSIEFDGKLRLAGVRTRSTRASPGRPLEVTLALQAIGQLDRDYALTVRLVDANDARRTQQDRLYPTRTFAPGEVRVDRFTSAARAGTLAGPLLGQGRRIFCATRRRFPQPKDFGRRRTSDRRHARPCAWRRRTAYFTSTRCSIYWRANADGCGL